MQNTFIQVQGDQIIVDKNQLIMYSIAAAIVVVLLIVITIAVKSRKKNFIRTIPTNLKDEIQ
jgi:hypothetical protein